MVGVLTNNLLINCFRCIFVKNFDKPEVKSIVRIFGFKSHRRFYFFLMGQNGYQNAAIIVFYFLLKSSDFLSHK